MEMRTNSVVWLDEFHPNFTRWQRARELSIERGKLVQSIVNQKINTCDLKILDLGSGEGGTSQVFANDNFVISLDLNLIKLKRQNANNFICCKVNGNATCLPFSNQEFDLIIIQDVIEHIYGINEFYSEVKRVLKPNGMIYLSTPNKYSIINFLSDPHFGLPILSLFNREVIKKYFLKYFRTDDFKRNDIAQLLSLHELLILIKKDYEIFLYTKFTVQELLNGNKGIIWSNFHLKMIRFIKALKLDHLINRLSNNNFGIFNKFVTPTFYLILNKNS
jgi:SAM-dependent methyltransferase